MRIIRMIRLIAIKLIAMPFLYTIGAAPRHLARNM